MAKRKSLLQEKSDTKEQRNNNATTNWDAIHAKYAAMKYKTEDSWELVWYKDYTGNSDSSPIDELKSMKIKLFGDSILYLNGKKLKVCRTVRDPFMYQRDALYYPSLTKYFANLGINITKSVPVLLLQSTMKDVLQRYAGIYLHGQISCIILQRICRSIQVHQSKKSRFAISNRTFSVYRCRFV